MKCCGKNCKDAGDGDDDNGFDNIPEPEKSFNLDDLMPYTSKYADPDPFEEPVKKYDPD